LGFGFCVVGPAWGTPLEGDEAKASKSFTHPTGGSVSRTARVSIARWNLKEAAGKTLV
jgi:hypothetical protein